MCRLRASGAGNNQRIVVGNSTSAVSHCADYALLFHWTSVEQEAVQLSSGYCPIGEQKKA